MNRILPNGKGYNLLVPWIASKPTEAIVTSMMLPSTFPTTGLRANVSDEELHKMPCQTSDQRERMNYKRMGRSLQRKNLLQRIAYKRDESRSCASLQFVSEPSWGVDSASPLLPSYEQYGHHV